MPSHHPHEPGANQLGRDLETKPAAADWGGRRFGELTPAEQHAAAQHAMAQVGAELTANADQIGAVLAADPPAGPSALNELATAVQTHIPRQPASHVGEAPVSVELTFSADPYGTGGAAGSDPVWRAKFVLSVRAGRRVWGRAQGATAHAALEAARAAQLRARAASRPVRPVRRADGQRRRAVVRPARRARHPGMSPPPGLLEAVADAARPAVLARFAPDSCIATTRVIIEALRYFGVPAVAWPVNMVMFNAAAWPLVKARVPAAEWPEDAWSVGFAAAGTAADGTAEPGQGRPRRRAGHHARRAVDARRLDRPDEPAQAGHPGDDAGRRRRAGRVRPRRPDGRAGAARGRRDRALHRLVLAPVRQLAALAARRPDRPGLRRRDDPGGPRRRGHPRPHDMMNMAARCQKTTEEITMTDQPAADDPRVAWPGKPAADEADEVVLHFTINGTDANPYGRWGLRQNPFPQVSTGDAPVRPQLALQSLGGEPVRDAADIRERLAGYFTPGFIEGVVARWKPGEMVRIRLTFPRRDPS